VGGEPKLTLSVSSDISENQLEELRSVLRNEAAVQGVQEETRRITGVEWAAIIIALKVTGAGAGAAAGILNLANAINKWRRQASKNDAGPEAFFIRPNQPQLNLATATDKEVRNWLATAAADAELPQWMATATDEEVRVWISRRQGQGQEISRRQGQGQEQQLT
jgi:hypothetical protein